MNKREIAEIKRRINPEKSNIERIYTCYVNGAGEIITMTDESVGILSNEEKESYFSILRKAMGGTLGKNLINLSFDTSVVASSEEHRLLSELRKTGLKDEALREKFFRAMVPSISMDGGNYLILLALDRYDVPHRGKDGIYDAGSSDEVFTYLLCGVCPVKNGKAELGYDSDEKRFSFTAAGSVVAAPEIGFLYPAFDGRSANLYGALLFSKSSKENHSEFADTVFKALTPMAPAAQSDTFVAAINETISEEADFSVIQNIHEQISTVIEAHKESKSPEQLTMTIEQIGNVLLNCGIENSKVEQFEAKCAAEFGDDADLVPSNLLNTKKLELQLPEIKITCNPMFSNLIQTKLINGKKYILISADSGVEVNGIPINIDK